MKFTKQNPLRVITLFSGYDSQCISLDRLKDVEPNFEYDLVAWCEIDDAAIQAHDALYPQYAERNIGDITKADVESLPDCDLITWSFPCTDISQAGKQAGLAAESGTRSSLAWDAIRIFEAKRPKYLMMENVAALVSRKFINDYYDIVNVLEKIGYDCFTQLLNAKDFNCPQNRLRVFMISILRTDNDPNPRYFFPKAKPLDVCLADVLERDVDEKYFLSDEMLARFCEKSMEEENLPDRNRPDIEEESDVCDGEDNFEDFFVAQ